MRRSLGNGVLWRRARSWLPQGGSLPEREWLRRHRTLTSLLWLNVIALPIYGLVTGHGLLDTLAHFGALVVFAAPAGMTRLDRQARSVLTSVGLLTACALLVHLTGGLIEAHFYFFVMIVALTLYESWLPFLVAVAYVLVHHGVLGTIDPQAVYNRPDAWEQPWLWAGVHAGFVSLAGIAGIAAWRLNERVREQMRRAQSQLAELSETDSLTGLGNRRKAMADLEALLESNPGRGVLALYDLDGFKAYNDTFGHPAGDAMLARLGRRLAERVDGRADAYRLGGDEFLLISSDPAVAASELEETGLGALHDHGHAFVVGASCGSVSIPGDATSVSSVMHLADERMYARKNATRTSAMSQSKDVLLQALSERYPDLEDHVGGVSELVRPLALALGVSAPEIESICHAAELHDIGKVAIPEAILNKPGPLDAEEWTFMRRHTIIGERIVAAAPALQGIGALIRSSHERWDGDGYPDGLMGEQIPIGARIISACDAFDAMRSERPYRSAIAIEDALDELERCAGSQFDPRVVAAFVELVREREPEAAKSRVEAL